MPRTTKQPDHDLSAPTEPPATPRSRGRKPAVQPAAPPAEDLVRQVALASQHLEMLREQAQAAHLRHLQELSEGMARLRQELGETTRQVQALPGALAEARQKLEQLVHQLPSAEQHRREQDEAMRIVREQLDALNLEHRAAQRRLAELRQETEEAETHLRALRDQAAEAERSLEGSASSPEGRNRLGVTVMPGVVVAEVQSGAPGEAAGLLPGDVLAAVNGTAVLTGPELRDALLGAARADEIRLTIGRGGKMHDVSVRPAAVSSDMPAEEHNGLGLTVDPGVVVAEVIQGTPAHAAQLLQGDVIVAVNDTAVLTGEQLRQALLPLPSRAEVRLRIRRGGQDSEVRARLDEG